MKYRGISSSEHHEPFHAASKLVDRSAWRSVLDRIHAACGVELVHGDLEHVPVLGSLSAHGIPFTMFFLLVTVAWFVSGTDKRVSFERDDKW